MHHIYMHIYTYINAYVPVCEVEYEDSRGSRDGGAGILGHLHVVRQHGLDHAINAGLAI